MQIDKLSKEMADNLKKLGYSSFTPIQEMVLPHTLSGKDVIAQAKTGSGKTAAFGIGIIERLKLKEHGVQALIMCPTRELAEQVTQQIRLLARAKSNVKVLLLCGGHSFGYQLSSLKHEAHIIVGTPGRILKHLKKETLKIDKLKTLVLDEADRLLDMGFIEDIEEIISHSPKSRETLLFSATFSDDIKRISNRFQKDPIEIKAPSIHESTAIEQHFYQVESSQKIEATLALLAHYKPASAIIFTNLKAEATRVADELFYKGVDAIEIHGDMEQLDRTQTLIQFANSSATVLVATDVAARGLDIKGVESVVNYDMPRDKESYIHRIGRVGRAGESGLAISLVTQRDRDIIEDIESIDDLQIDTKSLGSLKSVENFTMRGSHKTICIYAGRKDKLRAGDILGALAKDGGFNGKDIGKIDIGDRRSYVAIKKDISKKVLNFLQSAKVKNRKLKVDLVD